MDIIQALAGLFIKKFIRKIGEILMQNNLSAYVKQVDKEKRCSN